jgi:glutaredoxin
MDYSQITEKLDLILSKLETHEEEIQYQSKQTNELNAAIAKASSQFPKIVINRQNPYLASGYSDLDQIMNKIRPILGANELHLTQQKRLKDGTTYLITRIWHSSGQWIESRVILNPNKNTIESYGSHLNCMKRFEVMDMLGITVSDDPFDDDGEADMEDAKREIEMGAKLKTLYNKKNESYEVITDAQYGEIMMELDDEEDLTIEVLSDLKIRSFRELPKTRFLPTIKRIRKIKELRKGKYNS